MKTINSFFLLFLMFVFPWNMGAQTSEMFYATMQTKDAVGLLKDHPEDIKIIESNNGYSAVMLTDDAAHELHHKVLVHGPGFIYESSKKNAISTIQQQRLAQKLAGGYFISQEPLVRQSLDLVNNFNIATQIQELEDYGSRYHTTNSAIRASEDLKVKWEGLAAGRSDVSVRLVNHNSSNMPSVVMTITGSEKPDEFVVVGGHLDSTASGGNANNAPGADDNASGIATITEAARVLFDMNFQPKRTVEFMAFAAEEVGLRGSKEIAEDYNRRNVNIVSYMQLDMTNYKGSTNDVYVSTDSYNDDDLNDFLVELMDYYNASGPHKITYGTSSCNYGCSDHYSFAQQGYSTAFPFEATFRQSNPNIHTTRDTFDRSPTPNATHAAKFAKLALEYLIEISNGVGTAPPPPPPPSEDCTGSIASYPYNQGFEGSIGDWSQSTNDDIDFTVNSGGTPSNNTGPDGAADGNSYIFVEASGEGDGFPNKVATINSPCINLSSLSTPTLGFKYHMLGSSINSLTVEARTNNTGDWTSVFERTGGQGNSWNTASVDLAAYAGESSVQLRLTVVTGNGNEGWQSDIAIDTLSITNGSVTPPPPPPPPTGGCSGDIASFPYNESYEGTIGEWSQDTADDIDWTVNSGSTPSNNTGPSAASDGNSYIYVEASGDGTGFPNKVATLNSPCIDLSVIDSPTLAFDYHMNGSSINSLTVEARVDNEGNWVSVFNKEGAQGNDWNIADVDLSAYEGEGSVQLRITAVTGSGGEGWQSDIAIDALSIKEAGSTPPPPPPPPPGGCDTVDFNNVTVSSYANQDRSRRFTIVNGGDGIRLTRNTWKSVNFDYTITANTVLQFEFSSTDEGEVNGIGFDDDNNESGDRIFKLYGTENYGITNYDTYNGGTETYVIPVGDYYTGTMNRLVFVSDSDSWFSNSNSQFVNVKVYEGSCGRNGNIVTSIGKNTPTLGNLFDTDLSSGVSISPNPAKDTFDITISGHRGKNMVTNIYSILGQKMAEVKLQPGINSVSASNLSLQTGIYLVKVVSEGEVVGVKKLVIQK